MTKTAKEFLRGKTMRVQDVNLKEPPGGTFRAVHASQVEELLEEFAQQFRSQPETERRKIILECLEKYEGNGHRVVAEQIEIALRSQPETESKTKEEVKEIASIAWKGAANAYRMYPENKHTFTEYWAAAKSQFDKYALGSQPITAKQHRTYG